MNKTSLMAAALLAALPVVPDGGGVMEYPRPRGKAKPKEFTASDQERLDKAQAKRDRKTAKRATAIK